MDQLRLNSIALEITHACNLRCAICDHPVLARREPPMGISLLIQVISDAADLGVKRLTFTGGEPLLHEGIIEAIRAAKRRRMQVTLVTNGTLLSPNRIDWLLQDGVSRFVISITGNEATDCSIRGAGAWELSMAAIRYLLSTKQGARLVVNMTICSRNYHSFRDYSRELRTLGVRWVTYNLFSSTFLSEHVEKRTEQLGLTEAESLTCSDVFPEDRDNVDTPCNHILESCVVENDGRVSPCWHHSGRQNVISQSLRSIVESETYRDNIANLRQTCRTCHLACYNLGYGHAH